MQNVKCTKYLVSCTPPDDPAVQLVHRAELNFQKRVQRLQREKGKVYVPFDALVSKELPKDSVNYFLASFKFKIRLLQPPANESFIETSRGDSLIDHLSNVALKGKD